MTNPYQDAQKRIATIRAELERADSLAVPAELELTEIQAFRQSIGPNSTQKDLAKAEDLGARAGQLAPVLKEANRIRQSFRPELERAEADLEALNLRVREARAFVATVLSNYEDRTVRELRSEAAKAREVLSWVNEEPGSIAIEL